MSAFVRFFHLKTCYPRSNFFRVISELYVNDLHLVLLIYPLANLLLDFFILAGFMLLLICQISGTCWLAPKCKSLVLLHQPLCWLCVCVGGGWGEGRGKGMLQCNSMVMLSDFYPAFVFIVQIVAMA